MKFNLFFPFALLLMSSASAADVHTTRTYEIPRSLHPLERMIERAHDTLVKGLDARTTARGIADLRRAEHTYTLACHRVDRLARRRPSDVVTANALVSLRERAQEGAVEACIDTGHVLVARADYQGAVREADRALAIDPESAAALDFRDEASAPGSGIVAFVPYGVPAGPHGFLPRGLGRHG